MKKIVLISIVVVALGAAIPAWAMTQKAQPLLVTDGSSSSTTETTIDDSSSTSTTSGPICAR